MSVGSDRPKTPPRTTRVFLVDDSRLARHALRRLLRQDPMIELVGEASNGREALRTIPRCNPDLVLMDVVLPLLDGLATTRRLMRDHPKPILLISDLVGRDARLNFEALRAGALDILGKPTAAEIEDPSFARAWLRKLRSTAQIPVITRRADHRSKPRTSAESDSTYPPQHPDTTTFPSPRAPWPRHRGVAPANRRISLVAIGASTGGPPAIRQILTGLATPPWPVVIVQHMTPGFLAGMARWLATETGLPAQLVEDTVSPRPGELYFAPDRRQLELDHGRLRVTDRPAPFNPSVDVLFHSLATSDRAPRTAAVLLTGMGVDGAEGLLALRQAGAMTFAQDEATSAVWGMPRRAVELGAARETLALHHIAGRLLALPCSA